MGHTILVVDDEQKMREIISLFLKEKGMTVIEASSGKQAISQFEVNHIDLIVLDVMLGDMSGFDVCKKVRETSQVPIIFLSALGDDDYYMAGYMSGADDYIAKPFKASILALKVERILARTSPKDTIEPDGSVVLKEDSYQCIVEGSPVQLTKTEFQLLQLLMKNRGRILTRELLLETIWEYDYCGESRVVDNHIKNLRRKLGKAGNHIKTIISVGYKYEEME